MSKGKQADVISINQVVEGQAERPVAKIEPAVLEQPKEKPLAVQAYRVTRGGHFSMHGHTCRVVDGHIVRLSAYGAEGIARMKEAGIALEPFEI